MSSSQRANLAERSFCIRSLSFPSSCKYLLNSSIHIGLSRDSMMSSSRVVASASSASSSTSSRIRSPWVDLTEDCFSPAPAAFSPLPSPIMVGELVKNVTPEAACPLSPVCPCGGLELPCSSPLLPLRGGWN